jgi:hypothetical protein
MTEYPNIVVAFKKKWGSKVWLKTFDNLRCPDPIIAKRSKKYLPEGAEILAIGVGKAFEDLYRKKYILSGK